jgi:DNA-binding NarL/FixJ family response regulator
MPGGSVRVLIVDDQPLFREAARAVVDATPGFEALEDVTSAEAALARVDRLRPDIVFVDVRLPGMDGLEACRRLCAMRPELLVVLLSADDDPVLRDTAPEVGAAAFVAKKDLRPAVLRTLWGRHGDRAAAITPPG